MLASAQSSYHGRLGPVAGEQVTVAEAWCDLDDETKAYYLEREARTVDKKPLDLIGDLKSRFETFVRDAQRHVESAVAEKATEKLKEIREVVLDLEGAIEEGLTELERERGRYRR